MYSKLATEIVMENPMISKIIRKHEAIIMEVNPTYVLAMKNGMTEDIMSLYYALNEFGCVLQYTRSGRIAVTRSTQEEVSEYLEQREKEPTETTPSLLTFDEFNTFLHEFGHALHGMLAKGEYESPICFA